jgi:hypothetical protein
MPLVLACGNIVWELLWGFVFQSNYQFGVMASMGTACIIDLTICYGILKFNAKYFTVEYYAKNIRWLMAFGIGLWVLIWWSFKAAGMDTDAGAASGNILNILIALLWVNMVFTIKDFSKLSSRLGWLKLIGDIPLTLFVMVRFPDNPFVLVSGWMSVLFDALYLIAFYLRRNGRGPFKPLAKA